MTLGFKNIKQKILFLQTNIEISYIFFYGLFYVVSVIILILQVKIEDGNTNNAAVKTPAEANGGAAVPAESDKKDDSGNETGQGETGEEEDHEFFYDKSKSFFDKISCEAVERAKGKSQRTDWRTERKLNSETFGVSATRRGK